MPRDVRLYLLEIAEAARWVLQAAGGKTLADYEADQMWRLATERQFEIIGEALTQALRLRPELTDSISDTRSIVALRNAIIHRYFAVSDESLWGIIEEYLPTLLREVEQLLEEQS